MTLELTRRSLLRRAFLTAAVGATAPVTAMGSSPATVPAGDPFALLGAASGDPTSDGVVLWTRLARDLSDTARWGLDADSYELAWDIESIDAGSRVARSGTTVAARDKGYAVHVEAAGLEPARDYRYRFRIGKHEVIGRTRTAPASDRVAERLRLCFCSCAEFENELFFAYDQMAQEQPDIVVHLGDYIYEETYDRFYRTGPDNRARKLQWDRAQPLRTLAQYRRRYGEHHADPMLKRAHAAAPWIVTWDDHEVANDYAGDSSGEPDEADFTARRIAAYRAYFENLPIRLSTLPLVEERRQLYRRLAFGQLLTLHMLDERQYRDPQACRFAKLPGGKNIGLADCPELASDRTLLGRDQERWLAQGLAASTARWDVLAQGVMFAHLETRSDPRLKGQRDDPHMWNDTWSGYLPARQRVIDTLAAQKERSALFISGDIHNHFVNRVFRDWRRPGADPVATEVVTAAVSSFARNLTPIVSDPRNKDVVAFYDKDAHGYVSLDITPAAVDVTMVRIADKDRISGTSRADRSVRFQITRGDPEPRRVPG